MRSFKVNSMYKFSPPQNESFLPPAAYHEHTVTIYTAILQSIAILTIITIMNVLGSNYDSMCNMTLLRHIYVLIGLMQS